MKIVIILLSLNKSFLFVSQKIHVKITKSVNYMLSVWSVTERDIRSWFYIHLVNAYRIVLI